MSRLKSNLRAAEGAARRHFSDIRNKTEVAFQRSGHGRGHHLRTGTRHRCLDHQGRKIDLRQRSDRKAQKGQEAGKSNTNRQEGGRYRA